MIRTTAIIAGLVVSSLYVGYQQHTTQKRYERIITALVEEERVNHLVQTEIIRELRIKLAACVLDQ